MEDGHKFCDTCTFLVKQKNIQFNLMENMFTSKLRAIFKGRDVQFTKGQAFVALGSYCVLRLGT